MICPDCGHKNIPGVDNCENCTTSLQTLSLPQPDSPLSKRVLGATVGDLSPRPAHAVSPHASLAEAVALMRKEDVGGLLVLEDGKLVGLLTERDLLYGLGGGADPKDLRVCEKMHPEPACLNHDDPMSVAFHYMAVGNYLHLPVRMEDGSWGRISSLDILRYVGPAGEG